MKDEQQMLSEQMITSTKNMENGERIEFYIILKSYENMLYTVHTVNRPYSPPCPPYGRGYPNIEIISAS